MIVTSNTLQEEWELHHLQSDNVWDAKDLSHSAKLLLCRTVIQASCCTILKLGHLRKSRSRSLALRFNGHFPGAPGLAGVY